MKTKKHSRSTTSSTRTIYRLPDGTETRSYIRYGKEWDALANTVAEALDCIPQGWDSDIYLETKTGVRFQLPLCVARKVVELAEDAVNATTTWYPPWRCREDASV